MSDAMMFGIAKMPYELAMSDELSRRQFYANTHRLVAALEAARADAERYRWLKKSAFCNVWARGDGIALVVPRTPVASVDSKIDAEMAKEKDNEHWPLREKNPQGALLALGRA